MVPIQGVGVALIGVYGFYLVSTGGSLWPLWGPGEAAVHVGPHNRHLRASAPNPGPYSLLEQVQGYVPPHDGVSMAILWCEGGI